MTADEGRGNGIRRDEGFWRNVKAHYLRASCTYESLAREHGVSVSTLEKRARRENWQQ